MERLPLLAEIDKKIIKRINELIKDIKREPFSGIDKPAPLKHNLTGFWSRRITEEHRLIHRLTDKGLEIASCRYLYNEYN